MFGKLLKHEIRHSARYNLMIYLAALGVTLVTCLSFIANSTALSIVSCMALYGVGFVTVIVTFVSVVKNFYDTMFSNQGYLTHTLPVKGRMLLLSKVLVSFLWIIIGFAIMVGTWLFIFFYFKGKTQETFEMLKSVISGIGLLELLPSASVLIKVVVMLVILGLAKILTYVGYVYFAVTVANTRAFQSHPKLFGGITFLAVMTVISNISNFLTTKAPLTFFVTSEKAFLAFESMGEIEGTLGSYGVGGTLFTGLVAFGLLVATAYIIENKVNIK